MKNEWVALNARRMVLIEKKFNDHLTAEEKQELRELQDIAYQTRRKYSSQSPYEPGNLRELWKNRKTA